MKTNKELLEYYGNCCVSEYVLEKNEKFESEEHEQKDALTLENIRGQKKALEYILDV